MNNIEFKYLKQAQIKIIWQEVIKFSAGVMIACLVHLFISWYRISPQHLSSENVVQIVGGWGAIIVVLGLCVLIAKRTVSSASISELQGKEQEKVWKLAEKLKQRDIAKADSTLSAI